MAGLITDGRGNLYGTTSAGGASNNGTVFKLDITGETVLYSFCASRNCTDGAFPGAGLLLDKAGNLYGTTLSGGTSGHGVVFKLAASGKERVLHGFAGNRMDGTSPQAGLITDPAGNLYGTTTYGGSFDDGIVFKLNKAGKETVLHNFTGGADGGNPQYGSVVRDAAGNLYGTTYTGGSFSCGGGDGCGTVFKLDKTGKEIVFHNFSSQQDGQTYAGLIRDAAGNFYGTTAFGGPTANGVVFKLDATGTETILHSFTGGTDGGFPYAGLVRDTAGNLYGTTQSGGASGWGVVFKLDASGTETVLYSFTGGTDGGLPYGDLIRDGAGNLYGTTNVGGASNFGVVFKVTP
jgi:uncharacterized repeat protein (TIGR03803 family)